MANDLIRKLKKRIEEAKENEGRKFTALGQAAIHYAETGGGEGCKELEDAAKSFTRAHYETRRRRNRLEKARFQLLMEDETRRRNKRLT